MNALTGHEMATPLVPGSDEWLRTGSASKTSVILGLAPKSWGTRHSLYHQIRKTTPAKDMTAVMERGHELEPLIRKWFARDHPHLVVRETGSWQHNERPWQTADPDGLAEDDEGDLIGLEVKTAQYIQDWNDPGPEQRVPPYYDCQGQWQMDTIGHRRTIFAVCGPYELFATQPKYYTVEYRPELAPGMRRQVMNFFEDVEMGIEPEPDYEAEPDRNVLKYKHPHIDDLRIDVPDEVALAYLRAKASEAKSETAGKADVARLQELLGDHKYAMWNGMTLATRQKGAKGAPPKLVAARGLKDQAAELVAHYEHQGLAA